MQTDTFFTITEVSGIFKISTDTVLRLIKAGKLSASKIGNQWRITDQDIAEYQKRRKVQAKKLPV